MCFDYPFAVGQTVKSPARAMVAALPSESTASSASVEGETHLMTWKPPRIPGADQHHGCGSYRGRQNTSG